MPPTLNRRIRKQTLSLDTLRVDSFAPCEEPIRAVAITNTNCPFTHVDSTCPCCSDNFTCPC